MVKRFTIIIIAGLFLAACAPPTYQRSYTITAIHQYELVVQDINGKPIEGAEVTFTIEKEFREYNRGQYITNPDGKLTEKVSHSDYLKSFPSSFRYTVSKEGYYKKSGEKSIYGSDKKETVPVILLKSIDYLSPNFISTNEGKVLKDKILKFIDLILLQSLLADVELKPQTINLNEFKEKSYLQFAFTSYTVYNSLKMNKYDIGKRLFDEVVRKVLNPLNEYISDPKLFFGYDLKITGFTKDFTNKYALNQPIDYRFMIPQEVVKQYKNKDISGQQVLDASVILMDDERIELKLQ